MFGSPLSATGLAGVAAGIPYVAHGPAVACEQAPLVVVLHLMDCPWDEAAMAAALPLAGVPAWRAHLGLPVFVEKAAQELPGAVAGLREQLSVAKGPVVLVGALAGAAAVLVALADGQVPVRTAVLINPAVQAVDVVSARASDIASRLPQPFVLIVNDPGPPGPADDLYDTLTARWWRPTQIEHVRIPELSDVLAADGVVGPWLTRRLAG